MAPLQVCDVRDSGASERQGRPDCSLLVTDGHLSGSKAASLLHLQYYVGNGRLICSGLSKEHLYRYIINEINNTRGLLAYIAPLKKYRNL